MKHIKNYVNKIEAMLAEQSAKQSKPRPKGLLASTMADKETSKEKPNELDIIARFVYGIRKAKEEMINDRK
jgi:hypothetical protein